MHLIRYLRRLMIRGRTQTSTLPNDPTTHFLPDIWATETKDALDAIDRMMSGLPTLPHRQRFLWWHRHHCEPCKDYRREWDAAWKNIYQGKELRIPQFTSLVLKEAPDVYIGD